MVDVKAKIAPVIDLIDESFDSKKSNQYHFSALLNENAFDIAVLDTTSNRYLALQSDIPYPFSNSELSAHKYKSASCAIAHNKFSLIPNSIFEEGNKKSLFEFNHPVNEGEKIYSDNLHGIEARNLFTISKKLESEARENLTRSHAMHNSTAFIEGLLVANKNNSGKKVFADFHSGYFEIIILEGRELLFSNAFCYKTPEEIAYFILFVYEQLRLNPETIELVLSGNIEKTNKEHALLFTYIRKVTFAALPENYKFSYKLEEIPSHKFFSLFNQYLCV